MDIKYKVVEKLFFGSDTIVEDNKTKEEADKLCDEYNAGNGDINYRWYVVEEIKTGS